MELTICSGRQMACRAPQRVGFPWPVESTSPLRIRFFCFSVGHCHLPVTRKTCRALDDVDPVAFQQLSNAVRKVFDDRVLSFHKGRQIQGQSTGLDAMFGKMIPGQVIILAGVEQGFAGYTPDVQAHARQGGVISRHRLFSNQAVRPLLRRHTHPVRSLR